MTTTTVERVDAQTATELDIAREQVAGLSVDGLLELQALINEELRQRVGSKPTSHNQNGVSNAANENKQTVAENHSFLDDMMPQPTEEEIEEEIRQMFTPEELEAAHKLDFNELINRPLPKSWSDTLIEMRGGEV